MQYDFTFVLIFVFKKAIEGIETNKQYEIMLKRTV